MEHVGFRPQILALLRRLHQDRCLLAVTLPDDKHIYSSALLEIHPEQDLLVLDELKPDTGHAGLLQGRSCRVRGELKGVTVAFAASLIEAGIRNGIAYYHMTLPATVNYGQRRAHYRPRVALALRTPVEFTLADGGTLTGTLLDISLGGLRVKLDGEAAGLGISTELPCRMQLPNGTELSCAIESRFVSGSPMNQLGGRFLGLQAAQRNLLQRFIRELEREELKKTPRGGR